MSSTAAQSGCDTDSTETIEYSAVQLPIHIKSTGADGHLTEDQHEKLQALLTRKKGSDFVPFDAAPSCKNAYVIQSSSEVLSLSYAPEDYTVRRITSMPCNSTLKNRRMFLATVSASESDAETSEKLDISVEGPIQEYYEFSELFDLHRVVEGRNDWPVPCSSDIVSGDSIVAAPQEVLSQAGVDKGVENSNPESYSESGGFKRRKHELVSSRFLRPHPMEYNYSNNMAVIRRLIAAGVYRPEDEDALRSGPYVENEDGSRSDIPLLMRTTDVSTSALTMKFSDKKLPDFSKHKDPARRDDDATIDAYLSSKFEESPIWMKRHLVVDTMSETNIKRRIALHAYLFVDGPFRYMWMRDGYDPRKDPESRYHQIIHIRVGSLFAGELFDDERGAEDAKDVSKRDEEYFLRKRCAVVQLREIDIPAVQRYIETLPIESTCTAESGWFTAQHLDNIRELTYDHCIRYHREHSAHGVGSAP